MNNFLMTRVFLFVLIGMAIFTRSSPVLAAEDNYTLLNPSKPIAAFSLKNIKNQTVTNKDLKGHWSLLFFGFTRCQYICPTTMTAVSQAYNLLKADQKPLPQVLFISIDPANDTPEKVGHYAQSFQPDFIGLTGQESVIQNLTHQLGVLYMTVKQGNSSTIDHSANLFLVNPEGDVAAVFTPPYEPKSLAKSLGTCTKAKLM